MKWKGVLVMLFYSVMICIINNLKRIYSIGKLLPYTTMATVTNTPAAESMDRGKKIHILNIFYTCCKL